MAQFGRRDREQLDRHIETDPENQPGAEVAPAEGGEVAEYSPAVLAKVRALVAAIPGDDGSGGERIVTQLLDATTVDDLNAPWEGTSGRNLAGKRLSIRGLAQRPSSFEGGAGVFLVVDAADAKTGDATTFTTSSIAVVLQLAQAYAMGMFPLICEVVVSPRPTARGFYPYHLRILAAGRKGEGQNATEGDAANG